MCLSNQKSVTPTFDRATGEGLTFGGPTVLSDFLVGQRCDYLATWAILLFGPLGLLFFTATSPVTRFGTMGTTSPGLGQKEQGGLL
jgi:hypothetical protein